MYENLINRRLMEKVYTKGRLHEKQYRFREKRSTLNVIEDVVRFAKRSATEGNPKWCEAIFISIRNAFNTAPWDIMVEKLEQRGVFTYLENTYR